MSQVEARPTTPIKPRRRRRWLWSMTGLLVAMTAIVSALLLWANSQHFQNLVRGRIVAALAKATGGRVEMRSFRWRLLDLEAEADGVVIHGLEDSSEAPYAQVEHLQARVSILGFFSPRILLRDLEVLKPQFHLVIYPDGSTNQPHPANAAKLKKPILETLFDLQAGHVSVEQGMFDLDNRAASFDFVPRYLPLDLEAEDASLLLRYEPAAGGTPEYYHVESGVRDLTLRRGGNRPTAPPPLHAYLQTSLDLTRSALYLRFLRVTARTRGTKDRTLEVSGTLSDFDHGSWQAKATGEFDMRLLEPIFDYPFTPDGVASMSLTAMGNKEEFRVDGPVHIENGAYVAPGVNARNLKLDTRVHADPSELHIGSIGVQFLEGGRIDGDLLLDHWLPHLRGETVMMAPEPPSGKPPATSHWNDLLHRHKKPAPEAPPAPAGRDVVVKAPETEITVKGTITSRFQNVTLNTVMDIVGPEPFRRLGMNPLLNGTATADWIKGDVNTLTVGARLDLTPSDQLLAGEEPSRGVIDATYAQRTGAVDVRRLEITLPDSQITAHGRLGAYPLTSSTSLNVDFTSRNLGDFNVVLRKLGLVRNGQSGTAALPVALGGEAEFHGTWTNSLLSPRVTGTAKATQLSIELPPKPNDPSSMPQIVRWDLVEANGSYEAERISIMHGHLVRGESQISFDGTLTDAGVPATGAITVQGDETPSFDSTSMMQVRAHFVKVALTDSLPLLGIQSPVTGTLDGNVEAKGAVDNLGGSGWVELNDGVVYGEKVQHARAEGALANRAIKLNSFVVKGESGSVTGSGSYDISTKRFQGAAQGSGLEIAKMERLRSLDPSLTGRLTFSANASGTLEEPALQGKATLADCKVNGESLGTVEMQAHTVKRDILYEVATQLESADVMLRGQTGLHGDYPTKANLDFSKFNIGAILRLAHMNAIRGESDLTGTASVEGPLAHLDQLHGEARMQSMAVTISGVRLQSEGGVHAALAAGRVTLDPVHITGEHTDMRVQAGLDLNGARKLDLAANGSINLKLAETLDPDLTAGGTTTFQVEAHGPLSNPGLRGNVNFENGSLSLEDIPNGLSQIQGKLEFNQNRLEVRNLTAMTGGGQLSLGGFLAYQHGIYADLSVTAKAIRIRYPAGVSSLADTTLHLQGTQNSLLLSGNVLLTRFSVSPDLDIAALAAQANAVQPLAAPDAPSNHIRLDVRIQSSPQLSFQNAFAKLAGDIDLRLRGTLATPSLLGRVSVTEGNATIAGTKYELQRGDLLFTNPVRIQPTIDLNATARVEDYDITLSLNGTSDKLSVSYRSDPPLPEADVVALLALGRTQSEQGIYTQQQQQAEMSPSTDVLLGGALNATVSSRVQKLFGAGSVKVDPNYLSSLGNSTTRITVDEQLGKYVTLTYATSVDTSAQQLLQADIAINRHVSLVVTRDESGVFSMVIKATRRYR
jgi:translocation and assembly module TamB